MYTLTWLNTDPYFYRMNWDNFRTELKALVHLGLPIALAEFSGMALATCSTLMMGKIGATEVAAIGAVHPVFWTIALIGVAGLSMTSPLVAAAQEREDHREVKKILYASSLIALCLSLLLGLVMIGINLNFGQLGHPAEVSLVGQPYFWVLIAIFPILSMYFNLIYFTDGLSLTKVGMYVSLGGFVAGLFFNWVFIFGQFGLPRLGLMGLACSTVLVNSLQFLAMLWYLRSNVKFKAMREAKVLRVEVWQKALEYLKVSLPVGVQTVVEFMAYALGAVWVGQFGKYPLAAHQIGMTLVGVSFVVLMAIGTAGSIRIGQGLGQRNPQGVRLSGFSAMALALGIVLIPGTAYLFAAEPLAKLFIDDEQVWSIAASLITIAGFFQLSDATQSVGISLLRGLEDTTMPTVISLVAYWALGMPLGYYLAFHAGWGVQGVWMGYLVALSTQAVWFAWRFYVLSGRIREAEQKESQPINPV
jgi:multidrug resistance protein, MATE family